MGSKIVSILTNKWVLLGLGIVVGAGVILALRFVTYVPATVHYHANFAVYVNGQPEQFKGTQYYEETAASSCSLTPIDSPLERAHMHDGINSVVHVEDHLVTWGNFFQNINWGIGDDYLKTANQVYTPADQSKLTFILNGKQVDSIANTIIGDQDKLLVSYGSDTSQAIQKQYDTIQNKAQKYDVEQDPASCSGSHAKVDASERLKHLF
ncbi:MAG: hypothetical protein ABI716_01425 [Candidatus Saccharibacteria bacterium]